MNSPKSLKQFLAQSEQQKPCFIFHHHRANDSEAAEFLRMFLTEGKTIRLAGGKAAVFHRAHTPSTQDHLHFYLKQNQLYAINKDGTAHDASHGLKLHNWAVDLVKSEYPNFKIPPTNVIESMFAAGYQLIVEASARRQPLLTKTTMIATERMAARGGTASG